MLHSQVFRLTGQSMCYAESAGEGPPLVLLHGVLRRHTDFALLFPALAFRWRVCAIDFRGHGESDPAPDGYRVVDYARDILAFVEQAFDEPVVLYGHSLGAMVAAAVAAESPQRVRALVLEDPPFDTMGEKIRETVFHSLFCGVRDCLAHTQDPQQLCSQLADLQLITPGTEIRTRLGDVRDAAALRFMANCLSRVDPGVLEPIISGGWLQGYRRDATLRRVSQPTLLMQADFSTGGMLCDSEADEVESLITDCDRVRFPLTGHLIHWQAPEKTLAAIFAFLESI